MELIHIYQCFCDETRLRILNLLTRGPLCVCHVQEALELTQVRTSKHLGYLKAKGIVQASRHQNWMIYALPAKRSPELESNLQCLQDCVQTHPVFKQDLQRLEKIRPRMGWLGDVTCCPVPGKNSGEDCFSKRAGKVL